MESAKSAGWGCLGWGLCFVPIAETFLWLADATEGVPILPTFINTFFWITIVVIAVCFFYGIWGLACGYSQTAWDRYSKMVDDEIRKQAKQACIDEGIEPPAWLR